MALPRRRGCWTITDFHFRMEVVLASSQSRTRSLPITPRRQAVSTTLPRRGQRFRSTANTEAFFSACWSITLKVSESSYTS